MLLKPITLAAIHLFCRNLGVIIHYGNVNDSAMLFCAYLRIVFTLHYFYWRRTTFSCVLHVDNKGGYLPRRQETRVADLLSGMNHESFFFSLKKKINFHKQVKVKPKLSQGLRYMDRDVLTARIRRSFEVAFSYSCL